MATIIEPIKIDGEVYDLKIHTTSLPEGFVFEVDLQALVRDVSVLR